MIDSRLVMAISLFGGAADGSAEPDLAGLFAGYVGTRNASMAAA
jgi:hypothetical protein